MSQPVKPRWLYSNRQSGRSQKPETACIVPNRYNTWLYQYRPRIRNPSSSSTSATQHCMPDILYAQQIPFQALNQCISVRNTGARQSQMKVLVVSSKTMRIVSYIVYARTHRLSQDNELALGREHPTPYQYRSVWRPNNAIQQRLNPRETPASTPIQSGFAP